MRAILLAAGVGSRLQINKCSPKSTLDVGGIPLIRRTVNMLIKNNISVTIVVGYMKEIIYKALEGLQVDYCFNPFYKVTNSMGSLWFARHHIRQNEELILGNADVFWEQDILDLLLKDDHDAVMLSDKSRVDVGDYFFKTEDSKIVMYGKELQRNERDCEYVGIAKLSADFVTGFKERVNCCIEDELYDLWWENVLYNYSKEYPIYTLDVGDRFWGEIDYAGDYQRIIEHIKAKI